MNEKIDNLVRQALAETAMTGWDLETSSFNIFTKKFAELIIQKCMLLTERCMDDDTMFALNGAEIIAEHFGVEE